jgi:hypothetical protein
LLVFALNPVVTGGIHGYFQCRRFKEMRPYRIVFASFWDGFTSAAGMFGKVERPGSSSAELAEMTTPEMLVAYGRAHAFLPSWLLDLKEKERKRDVAYARLLRIQGTICLLALIGALSFVALRL